MAQDKEKGHDEENYNSFGSRPLASDERLGRH